MPANEVTRSVFPYRVYIDKDGFLVIRQPYSAFCSESDDDDSVVFDISQAAMLVDDIRKVVLRAADSN